MTIYVDDLQDYPLALVKKEARKHGTIWCHLATNGDVEELHAFAEQLGLDRKYFQDRPGLPHYDLTPRMRQKAMTLGAIPVSGQTLVRKCSGLLLRRDDESVD